MSDRPSIRPSVRMEQLCSHWKGFHDILYLSIFRIKCRENSSFIKIGQEYGGLHKKCRENSSFIKIGQE
jgi:hypothetical protein